MPVALVDSTVDALVASEPAFELDAFVLAASALDASALADDAPVLADAFVPVADASVVGAPVVGAFVPVDAFAPVDSFAPADAFALVADVTVVGVPVVDASVADAPVVDAFVLVDIDPVLDNVLVEGASVVPGGFDFDNNPGAQTEHKNNILFTTF